MICRLAHCRRAVIPFFIVASITVWSCSPESRAPTAPGVESNVPAASPAPGLSLALAAQSRHTDRLLGIKGVVGTAVGLDQSGSAKVQVFTRAAGIQGIPTTLDGTPVMLVVTGDIRPLVATAASAAVDPTRRFSRPVPIGVSTGNQGGPCFSGTIGARVKSGTALFALSNNHVYALENSASIGSNVLQPGKGDLDCAAPTNARLGKLSRFIPIVFSRTASNRVDAAIAAVPATNLRRSTPGDGYGTPRAATVAAALNQVVRKYGRTTGLTTGRVVAINATIFVTYSRDRQARFVRQIVIQNSGEFAGPGDSGSLIVDGSRRPVGLLFSQAPRQRDGSGPFTFANPIAEVLNALNVKIDGT
jgi:hypothetical protein